jgi:hypothetical protein
VNYGGFSMLKPRHAVFNRLLLAVFAAILPLLAGCGSQQAGAGATAGNAPAASQLNPTMSSAASNSAAKPRAPLRPGAKTKVLAAAGDRPYDKTFDDLRFEMKVGAPFHRSMLTKPIEAMAGQRIRIRGYVLPTPQRTGITQFVLVRDNQECCFGTGAALYDCILVDMKKGTTAEYSIRPVAVEGIFEVREFVIGGRHLAIYHMDAESVGAS